MICRKHIYFLLLILACLVLSNTQLKAQDTTVILYGRIVTEIPTAYSNIMVVNIRLGYGFAAKPDGSFEVKVKKDDEIKIFSEGFKTVTISLRDSVYKPVYFVNVELNLIVYTLDKAITIRPEPTLQEIEKEKSKIEQFKYKPLVSPGLAGIMNPISMLYQMFSREEKEKKLYADLLNQQEYDVAMKKIVRYFVTAGLFDLNEEEIERLIKFCNLNSAYIRKASMYEIGSSLNRCYDTFIDIERRKF